MNKTLNFASHQLNPLSSVRERAYFDEDVLKFGHSLHNVLHEIKFSCN